MNQQVQINKGDIIMKRLTAIILVASLIFSLMAVATSAAEAADTPTLFMSELYLTLYYKSTAQLHTNASGGNIVFESSNPQVVTVDEDGTLTAVHRGHAFVKATIEGTDVSRTCEISVEYTWRQLIIRIILMGFMWY